MKIFDIKPPGMDKPSIVNKLSIVDKLSAAKKRIGEKSRGRASTNLGEDGPLPNLKIGHGDRTDKTYRTNKAKTKTVTAVVGVLVLVLLVLAGCFCAYYFFQGQGVVIEIYRETKFVSHSTLANVRAQGDILGKMLEQENSASAEFSCAGRVKREEKATGTITIYNNYSSASQPLIATTRFISDSGQLFRIPKRVVVPGMGSVETTIVADQPCEEYNIGPSTFSIPGFAGGNKYTKFYGKTFSALTGGSCGEVAVASEQDFEDAETFLTNQIFGKGMEFLNIKREQGFIILDSAITQEVIEFSPLAKLNQEVDSFIAQIKTQTKAFAFKEQDLEIFAEKYIEAKIGQDRKIQEQSLNVNWEFERVNLAGDNIELKIEMNCLSFVDLDREELKREIAGKDFEEVARILASNAQIRRAVVKSKPFYMKKVPMDFGSIEIVDKF